jgi:hypothetical protein
LENKKPGVMTAALSKKFKFSEDFPLEWIMFFVFGFDSYRIAWVFTMIYYNIDIFIWFYVTNNKFV